MKVTIEPTSEISEIDGVQCRIWLGQTDSGIPVMLGVRLVVSRGTDRQAEFERELNAVAAPREARIVPFDQALRGWDMRLLV